MNSVKNVGGLDMGSTIYEMSAGGASYANWMRLNLMG